MKLSIQLHYYTNFSAFFYYIVSLSILGSPGISEEYLEELHRDSTPRELFDLYFTTDLWDTIVEETNLYARQNPPVRSRNMKDWEDTSASELQTWLGLRLLMGIRPCPSYSDYLSEDFLLEAPLYKRMMSRDRFSAL